MNKEKISLITKKDEKKILSPIKDEENISSTPKEDLSPPWYTLREEFLYTIGRSPFIVVNELTEEGDNFLLQFNVSNMNIALALREIVKLEYPYGNTKVITKVVGPNNTTIPYVSKVIFTPETIACNICWALYKNPLFIGTILDVESENYAIIGAVIKKRVIQFFADDLTDYCSSFLEVASKVFQSLLITSYVTAVNTIKVYYTTENKECLKEKVYYCC